MTVFNVVTCVVRPEKQSEITQILQELRKHINRNKKYKDIKSMKFFTQVYGGTCGAFVVMEEYNSLADAERIQKTMEKDKVLMNLDQKAMKLMEPSTFSMSLWKAIE